THPGVRADRARKRHEELPGGGPTHDGDRLLRCPPHHPPRHQGDRDLYAAERALQHDLQLHPLSRYSATTGATAASAWPSSRFITRTPVASRPWDAISRTAVRMTTPPDDTKRTSSSRLTMNAETTPPRRAVSRMPRTPWPPRVWRVNRSTLGRLPYPAY